VRSFPLQKRYYELCLYQKEEGSLAKAAILRSE